MRKAQGARTEPQAPDLPDRAAGVLLPTVITRRPCGTRCAPPAQVRDETPSSGRHGAGREIPARLTITWIDTLTLFWHAHAIMTRVSQNQHRPVGQEQPAPGAAPGARRSGLRDKHHELTRELIMRAVVEHLEREGFAEMTVPEVARAAGVSLRTVYRHFPTRDDLL